MDRALIVEMGAGLMDAVDRETEDLHHMSEVRFPNGVIVRAASLADRNVNAGWRTLGLYLDPCWNPDWTADAIDWPDFGVPAQPERAAASIRSAYHAARSGERVEVGCLGGLGRTGTVLACMAILAGVPAGHAVGWVRENYNARAIETSEQEAWVAWFGDHAGQPESSDGR